MKYATIAMLILIMSAGCILPKKSKSEMESAQDSAQSFWMRLLRPAAKTPDTQPQPANPAPAADKSAPTDKDKPNESKKEAAPVLPPPELPPVVPPVNNAVVTSTKEGLSISVPPGSDLEISSNKRENSSQKPQAPSEKTGLPSGIYYAAFGIIIIGGLISIWKFWYGMPLIVLGAFGLACLQTVDRYPKETAYGAGLTLIACVALYIWHLRSLHKTQTTNTVLQNINSELQASVVDLTNTLSQAKQSINKLSDSAKAEVKASIKSVVGDSTNPTRQQYDRVIQSV